MAVLFVLLTALLVFRALGALGVSAFAGWKEATRYALALMFLFTASAHFNKMRHDLARMMPKGLPRPMAIVYVTGVCEILGAIGILIPRFRSAAGVCLVLLMLAVFPANVVAATENVPIRGRPPTPLWLRAPMQVLFICLTWWSTRA